MPAKRQQNRIDVAVFPVAGRGTRFLPATKASPKEMLPIVDKPLIQYAVEEALAAGARRLVFITGSSKRAIEDHFDTDGELESLLLKQGKSDLLNTLRSVLPSYASCIYIRQPAPLGLGHAVLCAKPAVGDAPFFVHLADDLIDARGALSQADGGPFRQRQHRRRADRAAVPDRQVRHREDRCAGTATCCASSASSKSPSRRKAPSNLAVVGRYLLTPRVFAHLERIGEGAGGEIQLTDGIARLMNDEAVYAYKLRGQALRLRQQAGVSAGQRGIRAGAPGARQAVPRLPASKLAQDL